MGESRVSTEHIEIETIVVEDSTDTESAESGGDSEQTTDGNSTDDGGEGDGGGEGGDIKYHE